MKTLSKYTCRNCGAISFKYRRPKRCKPCGGDCFDREVKYSLK